MQIKKVYNKKEKKEQWVARFKLNNVPYRPKADTRAALDLLIANIRIEAEKKKNGLEVVEKVVSPTVKQLFDRHCLSLEENSKKKAVFERVSGRFLGFIPPDLKVNELRKAHFQLFIDGRRADISKNSGQPILPETINKELSALSMAFKDGSLYFTELEGKSPPEIQKIKVKKGRRRKKIILLDEFNLILKKLREPHRNSVFQEVREDTADDLEIKYHTGFRRAEVSGLEWSQYYPKEAALRRVERYKTQSETDFFPLTARAVEIIESRRKKYPDSQFIFSKDGKPSSSIYRMLKSVCKELKIAYGSFTSNGFVPHDLRHSFSTEIIELTDIETAKSLTGHTGQHIMTYLHTNEGRMRKAMNRREGVEVAQAAQALYSAVKDDKISLDDFTEKIRSLISHFWSNG